MVYIDENGVQIENPDLSHGHLVDAEWVDHPAKAQKGHYEYKNGVQTFVVDAPPVAAYREVTVKRYVQYTEAELAAMAKADYANRLEALEAAGAALESAGAEQEKTNNLLNAQIKAVSDRSDFIEDVIAEMAGIVYA